MPAELSAMASPAPRRVSFALDLDSANNRTSGKHKGSIKPAPDPALFQTTAELARTRALSKMEKKLTKWTIQHHGRAPSKPERYELAVKVLKEKGLTGDAAEEAAESLDDAFVSAREQKMELHKFGSLDNAQLIAQLNSVLRTPSSIPTAHAAPRPFLDIREPDNALPLRPVARWQQAAVQSDLLTGAMSDTWPEMSEEEGKALAKSTLKRTELSQNVILTAISYVQRLKPYVTDLRAASQHAGSPLLDGHKVLTATLMLANEMLNDQTYKTESWAWASDLPADEVKTTRYLLLKALEHDAMPRQPEFGARRPY